MTNLRTALAVLSVIALTAVAAPAGASAPITAAALTAGETPKAPAPDPLVQTAVVTPASDALLVLQVAVAGVPARLPDTVTGLGLTFDLLVEARKDAGSTRTVGHYIAQGAVVTGPVTMTWPVPPQSASWTLTQFAGVAVGGNGAAAVGQVRYVNTLPNNNFAEGNLPPLADPDNAVAAWFMAGARGQDIIPEAGYTKANGLVANKTVFSLAVAFRPDGGDLTPRASWVTVASNIWVAVELVAA